MTTMAGNLPNFEEALRALFAPDPKQFEQLVRAWPKDVRKYVAKLAAEGLLSSEGQSSAL